ncbi:hypothetical protein E1267_21545 [Nonomuraea longispora]|uniref:Uncharacterized protein n=1 Tax=Nonomuraea longispora TaxID=1848320 RepID=A0A4R4N7H6_9ACTN|nr:hypothetical protein [Nonomuraea longispora]TDC04821.1 hypothetical protein E1267_21545 [Nonomuraea longispora]
MLGRADVPGANTIVSSTAGPNATAAFPLWNSLKVTAMADANKKQGHPLEMKVAHALRASQFAFVEQAASD